MPTRLVMALVLLLLGVAGLQWWLHGEADGARVAPVSVSVSAQGENHSTGPKMRHLNGGGDLAEPVPEPELVIPEYIPPAVTERPRTLVGFDPPEVVIEIALPTVVGDLESDGGPEPEANQ